MAPIVQTLLLYGVFGGTHSELFVAIPFELINMLSALFVAFEAMIPSALFRVIIPELGEPSTYGYFYCDWNCAFWSPIFFYYGYKLLYVIMYVGYHIYME